jgi:hypothetical protein
MSPTAYSPAPHATSTIDQAFSRSKSMSDDIDQTNPKPSEFDFSIYPYNTLFHERRTERDRRANKTPPTKPKEPAAPSSQSERRVKKERRRRIDPTTFDKQYTDDEMEFMNAMQRFKESSGKSFPTHGEVLKVAAAIGYRRVVIEPEPSWDEARAEGSSLNQPSSIDA